MRRMSLQVRLIPQQINEQSTNGVVGKHIQCAGNQAY